MVLGAEWLLWLKAAETASCNELALCHTVRARCRRVLEVGYRDCLLYGVSHAV